MQAIYNFSNNGVEFNIPLVPHALKYWHWVCAKTEEMKVLAVLKIEDENGVYIDNPALSLEQINDVHNNAKTVFCDYVLALPDGKTCGDLIPFYHANDVAPETDLYELVISSRTPVQEMSQLKIYFHINNMCEQYFDENTMKAKLGDTLNFHFRNETYYIGSRSLENTSGLTANELIQASEMRRAGQPTFVEYLKQDPKDPKKITGEVLRKDFDLFKHMGTMCYQLAILARKKDEPLETNPLLKERFLERRAEYFKEFISFATIRDVDFFLSSLQMDFMKLRKVTTSGMVAPKSKLKKHRATMKIV
jgi:hypothetical protein